jgi:enamine deaminase RidA (YjgF/YER057c/UK114 family)
VRRGDGVHEPTPLPALTGDFERLAGDPPSPYEGRYGFSRLVTAGPFILIGGTTSVDEHGFVHGDTPYEQAAIILDKILHELGRIGAGAADVVHNRVYVTDLSRADEVGRAHGERFAEHRPLMTALEVAALIDPRMLVEIETVAYRA